MRKRPITVSSSAPKAAKEFFNAQHFKKLPKMRELSNEYGQILAEKKKEYAEYKEAKASMQDFLIARQNIEALLRAEEKEREEKKEKKELNTRQTQQ